MLSCRSLVAKVISSCLLVVMVWLVVGLMPASVKAMVEATYRVRVVYDPSEDGYVVQEGCSGPAGGCYVVTA